MNLERAAKSINVDRFMGLVKTTIVQNTGTSDGLEAKAAKIQQGLASAIEYYGQDRHVELGEYWPSYFAVLEAYGVVPEGASIVASPAPSTSQNPHVELTGEEAAEVAEEEALMAQNGEVSADAEVAAPTAASASVSSPTSAAAASLKKKRVITQQEIEERAKFNAGRSRYLYPEEDWEVKEATITNPVEYLKRSVLYKESVQKCREVKTILNDVEVLPSNTNKGSEKDPRKWTAVSKIDANGYGTYYRAEEATASHSLKVVGEVDANILSTLAVLCELDLYKEWFPMCWQSEEQGRLGDLHRWSTFTVSCPWPVASRTCFLGGFGCDCVYQKKIVIVAKSIDPSREFIPVECNLPVHQKGTVTATLSCGGFVIEPLKGGKTKVSFTMNVDPKLKNIPMSMINWFSAKLIWVLLEKLGSAAVKSEKKGSAYQIRREQQSELYEYFRQRALEVLPPDHL